jgi:hypothetical protein
VNINSQWHPLSGRKKWGSPVAVAGGWSVELTIPYAESGMHPASTRGLCWEKERNPRFIVTNLESADDER